LVLSSQDPESPALLVQPLRKAMEMTKRKSKGKKGSTAAIRAMKEEVK
jgi:hypothetical protein